MITSITNGRVKNVISLIKKARTRKEQGVFVVEGIRMVREAPKDRIKELYVSENFLMKEENRIFLEKEVGVPFEAVKDEVFTKMSDTVTPQGILCVLYRMDHNLEYMLDQKEGTFLILEDIQDPGNLGTMLRTGEAAGIAGVIMSSGTVDIYNPKVIRSTMGSIYRVPFCYVDDLPAALRLLRKRGVHTYAAHLAGDRYYDECFFAGQTGLLIGNEGNGLSDEVTGLAEHRLKIPMEGQVESLNAAVSASILMYEAYRQKRGRHVPDSCN
ncbi:MAG: RNA methyltransferase [Lachnospiraceae bacterium]|nr:RNA methyltransferase [Lachnospiraceae bacterium]